MKITQGTLKAFQTQNHASFYRSVNTILKDNYGWHPAVQTDADRILHMSAGISKAMKYEIAIGPDAAKLIFLMLELSPSFDEDPRWKWAEAILETRIENRMDRLISAALLALDQGNSRG